MTLHGFKEGDWVRQIEDCSRTKAGKTYLIETRNGDLIIWANKAGGDGCTCTENWRPVPVMNVGCYVKNVSEGSERKGRIAKIIGLNVVNGGMKFPYQVEYPDDSRLGYGNFEDYELHTGENVEVNKPKKTIMNKVSIMMKKLLDADTQELVKAGLINGDLMPTYDGISELNAILFIANKAALVERAHEINAEAEKNK